MKSKFQRQDKNSKTLQTKKEISKEKNKKRLVSNDAFATVAIIKE